MRLKANRKSQKFSPSYKLVENLPCLFSSFNLVCGRDDGNLTHSTLGKMFSRRQFEISFSLIFPENRIRHLIQIVSHGDICMKCQILFSWKNKKTFINLSSAEFAQSGKSYTKLYNRNWELGCSVII